MRWKNDMAAIAGNPNEIVFFILIFTVSCIGGKAISGYPSSSNIEDER